MWPVCDSITILKKWAQIEIQSVVIKETLESKHGKQVKRVYRTIATAMDNYMWGHVTYGLVGQNLPTLRQLLKVTC